MHLLCARYHSGTGATSVNKIDKYHCPVTLTYLWKKADRDGKKIMFYSTVKGMSVVKNKTGHEGYEILDGCSYNF